MSSCKPHPNLTWKHEKFIAKASEANESSAEKCDKLMFGNPGKMKLNKSHFVFCFFLLFFISFFFIVYKDKPFNYYS